MPISCPNHVQLQRLNNQHYDFYLFRESVEIVNKFTSYSNSIYQCWDPVPFLPVPDLKIPPNTAIVGSFCGLRIWIRIKIKTGSWFTTLVLTTVLFISSPPSPSLTVYVTLQARDIPTPAIAVMLEGRWEYTGSRLPTRLRGSRGWVYTCSRLRSSRGLVYTGSRLPTRLLGSRDLPSDKVKNILSQRIVNLNPYLLKQASFMVWSKQTSLCGV